MKKFLWMLFAVGIAVPAAASPALVDSLRHACDRQTDAQHRVDILLNLKDLTDSSDDEMYYSRLLCDEAFAAGDPFAVGASLGSLASHYISTSGGDDSLALLLEKVEPLLKGSTMEGLPAYYRMVAFARKIQLARGSEQAVRLCRDYLDSVALRPPGDLYEQASRLFLKGISAFTLASAEGMSQMERGLPYWEDELALLPRMQPTARRNFHANLITCLITAYSSRQDQDALVRVADAYLAMLDEYYRDPEIVRRRPYIAKEMSYMVCYYTMCTSPLLDKQKARAYYERYQRFMRSVLNSERRRDNILLDKRGFYNISVGYHEHQGDLAAEMAYNDSLILITRPSGMSPLLAAMYDRKARLLEKTGRYREACAVYGDLIAMRDSLATHKYTEKISELEVRYGLEKVERDRATIQAQKRKNSLYFTLVILFITVAWMIYLWRNLLRVKRLQHKLWIESQRALESDRLKSDFMGSMSHEIRTPLNAINGFAELIAAGNLSEEENAEFAQIIRENSQLFTSLINDMLEVAQLDNTNVNLPKTPLDLCQIVRNEVEHLPAKAGVEVRLVSDAPEVVVPLHRGYTAQLVRELLKNAVRFTDCGTVTVGCGTDSEGYATLTVSDTGCGVEPELAEKIFGRFYKANAFSQGLGLGLSLCKLVVEKSGGSIRLDTSYTGGARFIVRFPLD